MNATGQRASRSRRDTYLAPTGPVTPGRVLVGTSGWVYPSWKTILYEGFPKRRWLEVASRTFDTLEVNGSFYGQLRPETYARWRDEAPAEFPFCVKGHRFVTHYKRLRDVGDSIVRLRDQASALGDALACVLWQLPARMEADVPRLAAFCTQLIAHWPDTRHAVELRHASWFTDEVALLLGEHGVASCVSDAPDFPIWRAATTDLVYVRLHGHTRKYASSYSNAHLARWAQQAIAWSKEGRTVLVYFDNDAEGAAVDNALALRRAIDAATGEPPALGATNEVRVRLSGTARRAATQGPVAARTGTRTAKVPLLAHWRRSS